MDSTNILPQIETAQSQKEATANALFAAASPAMFAGNNPDTTTQLTFGYIGGRYGGTSVANGTNTCTGSTTTYMVSAVANGAITFSTSDTDWNNPTDYGRCYKIVTGSSAITSYEDHRFGPGGIMAAAGTADLHGDGLDADAAGFRGVPINSQSSNYTIVASDSGKMLLHPSGAGSGDTFTLDSNANVPFEVGTAITFVNMDSNTLEIAITSDAMYLAGAGTTGSRTLAQYGVATAVKLTSTSWIVSGTGLT